MLLSPGTFESAFPKIVNPLIQKWSSLGGSVVTNLTNHVGRAGSILELERPQGKENGNPLQYS